jgi:hypothetical protein
MGAQEACASSHQSARLIHAFFAFFTAAGTPSGCDAARPTL